MGALGWEGGVRALNGTSIRAAALLNTCKPAIQEALAACCSCNTHPPHIFPKLARLIIEICYSLVQIGHLF